MLRTLLPNVNQRMLRSKNEPLATTVFCTAVCGGVSEKCTETPVRSRSAILRVAEVIDKSGVIGEKEVTFVLIIEN